MARTRRSRVPHPNPQVANAGHRLSRVPEDQWPTAGLATSGAQRVELWMSRQYLVQVFLESGPDKVVHERLTVCRTDLGASGTFNEHIPWDVLQRLKRECGRGDRWAVEVFPPDDQVVDVANMRHLFVLPSPPAYGWRR